MAVRTPLKWDGTSLKELTSTEITAIRTRCRYLYGAAPSVTLSYVASGGTLGTITDTRTQAGAWAQSATAYPVETTTAEPSTVTVNYARISETVATTPAELVDTNSKAFPVYYDGTNIRAMSLTDMYDTFILPAIDTIQASVGQPGTYYIHTASTLGGYTAVSASPVYTDTRANTGLYTAAGIPEVQDQPTTITNYYLLKANNIGAPAMVLPMYVNADNNIQEYTQANIDAMLQDLMQYAAHTKVGTRLRYNLNGAGTAQGSGMVNTKLNGAGNYQILYVNTDDYRAQEFPDGTAVTVATHYLRLNQT